LPAMLVRLVRRLHNGLLCVDFFGDRFAKRLRDTVAAACSR
jgi:hypothetical protein